MINTDKIGFCWIPTLSGNIFSTKRLDFLELINTNQYLYRPKFDDDIEKEFYRDKIWIIDFNSVRSDEIIYLSFFETSEDYGSMSEDEITSIVEFGIKNISKTGFVTFEISINDVFFNTIICNDHNPAVVDDDLESHEESDEIIYDQIKTELVKELINQFYYIIREIYHVHTHHDKNHQLHSQNSNLLPIYLTNKDDFVCVNPAIVTIADNFKEKIPIYHDEINRLRIEINQKRNSSTGFTEINKDNVFNNWLVIIRMGIGEMLYAEQFVLGHCSDHLSKEYIPIFERAIKSFNSIFNEINAQYMHDEQIIQRDLQKQMQAYTIVIIYLTLSSIIFGYISCINNNSVLMYNNNELFCLCILLLIGILFIGYYSNGK